MSHEREMTDKEQAEFVRGLERKRAFVRELAKFLVEDSGRKSIELGMGKPHAQAWASLRQSTPIMGYPTVDEAAKQLGEWLGIPGT